MRIPTPGSEIAHAEALSPVSPLSGPDPLALWIVAHANTRRTRRLPPLLRVDSRKISLACSPLDRKGFSTSIATCLTCLLSVICLSHKNARRSFPRRASAKGGKNGPWTDETAVALYISEGFAEGAEEFVTVFSRTSMLRTCYNAVCDTLILRIK